MISELISNLDDNVTHYKFTTLTYRVAKFANPSVDEPVRHALKGISNEVSIAQRQARGLGWEQIKQFIDSAGEGLPGTRERALLCAAYDTMTKRSELVAFNRGDFKFLEDGSVRALIRRSKTEQAGERHTAYLAAVTVRYLKEWLELAQIAKGQVFSSTVLKTTMLHGIVPGSSGTTRGQWCARTWRVGLRSTGK